MKALVGAIIAVLLVATSAVAAPRSSSAELAQLTAQVADLEARVTALEALAPAPTPTATPSPSPDCDLIVSAGTTLASAIGNATSGDTLCLRGGTHTVSTVIRTAKALTIEAYPGEAPVITHPTNRPDFLYFTGGPVTVRGITFRTDATQSYEDSQGSALSEVEGGHDVIYEDVTFVGSPVMGEHQQLAYVRLSTGTTTFRRCAFIANGSDGFGVHIYPTGSALTVVEDSTFSGFGVSAAITAYSRSIIRSNTFRDSRLAIQVRDHTGTEITGNTGINLGTGIEGSGYTASGNDW